MSHNIGIVGCGNSARALAFYLASKGNSVSLYTRNPEKYKKLVRRPQVSAIGRMEGTVQLTSVTANLEDFCAQASTIFVATQATAYRAVAESLSPYLDCSKHLIVLFSGKLLGCLDFKSGLAPLQKDSVRVMETDSLFAARVQPDDSIQIRGIKAWTLFGAITQSEAREYGTTLTHFFPGLQPAKNLIHRGLTDFGAVAHAVISLANISKIDVGQEFYFYYDGLSENTICLLEEAEKEFSKLASAYGADLVPMKELLNRYYGCDTTSLYKAIRSVPNYRDSVGPKQLNHRYLQEDVCCTLVPMLELAAKAKVELPLIASVVKICSTLAKRDLKRDGRTLKRLGIANFSSQEIQALLEK